MVDFEELPQVIVGERAAACCLLTRSRLAIGSSPRRLATSGLRSMPALSTTASAAPRASQSQSYPRTGVPGVIDALRRLRVPPSACWAVQPSEASGG
jgi:hypothetical protein